MCKFHVKQMVDFFARGQKCALKCLKFKIIAPSLIPISIDLHVKCIFPKVKKKQKNKKNKKNRQTNKTET